MNRTTLCDIASKTDTFVHPRKWEVRIGSDVILGNDSTEEVLKIVNLALEQEREAILHIIKYTKHEATGEATIQAVLRAVESM